MVRDRCARQLLQRPWPAVLAVAVLLAVPIVASPYWLYLLSSIFAAALFAVSLNLALGHGGLLQLSQGTFYGVGAYAAALVLTKTALPFGVALAAAPVVAAAFAFLMGWFCVRLRQLYLGMLTLALGELVWALADNWYRFTGGDNGITAIPLPAVLGSPRGGYYLALLVMAVSLVALYRILHSPFGLTLQAARDNAVRSAGVGVDVQRHQLTAFVVSGFFAGLAGLIHVVVAGSVDPSLLNWPNSAEVLIMVLLGGLGTFIGPAVGAAILVLLAMVVGVFTSYWMLVMGVILVLLALFLPQGIVGFLEGRSGKRRGVRLKEEEE